MNILRSLSGTRVRSAPLVLGASFFTTSSDESLPKASSPFDHEVSETSSYEKMYANRSGLTWKERLKLMWRGDEYGLSSPELTMVYESCTISVMVGGFYGAYVESAKAGKMFIEKNKYEMFKHPREAQSSLQDRMMISYMKGFARYGGKMLLLTFTYMSVAQSMACVRNYINPLDHALAGGVMGAVYRFNGGPKGMLGAGFLGSILGLQGGILFWLVQYMTGETVEERWHREYLHIQNTIRAKHQESASEDPRSEILKDEQVNVVEEEETSKSLRQAVTTIRQWAQNVGLASRSQLSFDEDDN